MPKASFDFDLTTEREEYDSYRRGPSYIAALDDYFHWLRQVLKYESDSHSAEYLKAIEDARTKLWDLIKEIDN